MLKTWSSAISHLVLNKRFQNVFFWPKWFLIGDVPGCVDSVRSDECYLQRGIKVWQVLCCGLVWPNGSPIWWNICFPSHTVTSESEGDTFPSCYLSLCWLSPAFAQIFFFSHFLLLCRNNESLSWLSSCFRVFSFTLFIFHMLSVLFSGNWEGCNYNLCELSSFGRSDNSDGCCSRAAGVKHFS